MLWDRMNGETQSARLRRRRGYARAFVGVMMASALGAVCVWPSAWLIPVAGVVIVAGVAALIVLQ